jgi:pimeloyl-ACP methyl ester carboxylesterase
MARTIIFISGFAVPKWLAKTRFVWENSLWEGYRKIYLPSRTPLSDGMVERELDNLCSLVNQYPNVTLAGQSLGAWWAANLACHPQSKIKKLVLWTPLGDANAYPIFNVTARHHPPFKIPNKHNVGPHKTAVFCAKDDLIVPPREHAADLITQFQPTVYRLDGGHLLQSNHKAGLIFMKDWIELD